jgi:hypothetical protein
VYVHVYPLREKGQRLARETVIDRGPVVGELCYRERLTRSGIYLATLLVDDAGSYGLPPLDRAALHRVTPAGLMIHGMEVHTRNASIKAKAEYWPQVWWCVPVATGTHAKLPTTQATEPPRPAWQRATSTS